MYVISLIDIIDYYELVVPIKERLDVEALLVVITKFNIDGSNEYYEMVRALIVRGS